MMRYVPLFLSIGILSTIAHTTPCPTCPKGYSVIKMEELLRQKDKNRKQTQLQTKFQDNTSSLNMFENSNKDMTPVQMTSSRTEELKNVNQYTEPYKENQRNNLAKQHYPTNSMQNIDPIIHDIDPISNTLDSRRDTIRQHSYDQR